MQLGWEESFFLFFSVFSFLFLFSLKMRYFKWHETLLYREVYSEKENFRDHPFQTQFTKDKKNKTEVFEEHARKWGVGIKLLHSFFQQTKCKFQHRWLI